MRVTAPPRLGVVSPRLAPPRLAHQSSTTASSADSEVTMSIIPDRDAIARYGQMCQEIAEENGEPVLLVNVEDPRADAPARSPYAVLLSQSNAFERAHHLRRYQAIASGEGAS